MKQFDFDNAPERRGSNSYKWEATPPVGTQCEEIIPLWVADMDFKVAPPIIEALGRRVDHGIFGYTHVPPKYYEILDAWFSRRHGYRVKADSVIYVPGVVPAVSAIIKALTKPGDGVIVQTPVYNCFFSCIRNNDCQIVRSPLVREDFNDGSFSYNMDFESLEKMAADPENKILLLCNPHNPVGRVWSKTELERVAEICLRHNVTVVSDEIHCELVFPGYKFTSFALLDEKYTSKAVICNSPSKGFNTAGLQIANIICGNSELKAKIDRAVNINEVCDVNPFGVVGLMAAYSEGEPWLKALVEYLYGNYQWLHEFIAKELPFLPASKLEATYLLWLDISPLHISSVELEDMLIKECCVWLNAGEMYGDDSFMRINFACPRHRLEEAMRRVAPVLKRLHER